MASKTFNKYKPEHGMQGPFHLNREGINGFNGDEYGVYLLGHEADDDDEIVIVVYVGRGVIKDRLKEHQVEKDALYFYFKQLDDDDEVGFNHECRLYHKYGKSKHLYNEKHPQVPEGMPRDYPKCSELGCKGERY